MFKNPFKKGEPQQDMKQDADFQMSAQILGNPGSLYDEQAIQQKKEVLLQLTQWQQDRTKSMQTLFLKLSGYEIDVEKKLLQKSNFNKGIVNLQGAFRIVNFIEPLDRNVMLGNWSDTNITLTLRDAIGHPLREFLFLNHNEFDLELENATYLLWLIINTVEPTYRRGWNDGERRKDREIIKINEMRNPYFQQKKKAIFGMEA